MRKFSIVAGLPLFSMLIASCVLRTAPAFSQDSVTGNDMAFVKGIDSGHWIVSDQSVRAVVLASKGSGDVEVCSAIHQTLLFNDGDLIRTARLRPEFINEETEVENVGFVDQFKLLENLESMGLKQVLWKRLDGDQLRGANFDLNLAERKYLSDGRLYKPASELEPYTFFNRQEYIASSASDVPSLDVYAVPNSKYILYRSTPISSSNKASNTAWRSLYRDAGYSFEISATFDGISLSNAVPRAIAVFEQSSSYYALSSFRDIDQGQMVERLVIYRFDPTLEPNDSKLSEIDLELTGAPWAAGPFRPFPACESTIIFGLEAFQSENN